MIKESKQNKKLFKFTIIIAIVGLLAIITVLYHFRGMINVARDEVIKTELVNAQAEAMIFKEERGTFKGFCLSPKWIKIKNFIKTEQRMKDKIHCLDSAHFFIASSGLNTTDYYWVVDSTGRSSPGASIKGLIGYWRFDEDIGIVFYDAAGNRNSILTGNPIWNFEALKFDGDDSIKITDLPTIESVSLWVQKQGRQWEHIVKQDGVFWVNGIKNAIPTTFPVKIIEDTITIGEDFTGFIDDIRIYDRPLLAGGGEIKAEFEHGRWRLEAPILPLPPLVTHTLSVSVAGTGSVTGPGISCPADCTETYTHGTSVTLTATPGSGWRFSHWGGDCTETATTCAVTMDRARSVNAIFVQITHTLSVSVTGTGSVTGPGISCPADCTETYTHGTSVTLTATPGSGWRFSHWGGDCTGTATNCTVSMTTARSVIAIFTTIVIIPPPPYQPRPRFRPRPRPPRLRFRPRPRPPRLRRIPPGIWWMSHPSHPNDGILWAWGNNNYGQLGLGDTINRHSPAQVKF
jgi:hypothetical protein